MMLKQITFTLLAIPSLLSAQEAPSKPYQEGGVHDFLKRARTNSRSAVVLFNFNFDSG